jgi:hypothetical protein
MTIRRKICALAATATLLVPVVSLAEGPGRDPVRDLLLQMKDRYETIAHMQCRFTKEVTIDGRKVPRTSMLFRFRKSPETIYLEFLNRHRGRRCLYIRGENDGKMIVRPEGLLQLMTLSLDPMDEKAMQESSEPITRMGFGPHHRNHGKLAPQEPGGSARCDCL